MLPRVGKLMGDRRSWNTQPIHGKSSIKPVAKQASGSKEAFSKVLGNYTSNNVRLLSLQLYNYLNETREKVKRTHRFLKLANQKFLFVHFFACRVAQETNQYPLDFYMKESLVAYILLELNIINEPEFSGDFSHQTALKERVAKLLWIIYSKYMYYLTGGLNRVEVYAVICKFLQAELPPKIPDFFRDFVQEIKSRIAGTTIELSYFSAPLDIKVEPANTSQNIICADADTPNFIWQRFKEMQKKADDHQLHKEQGACIEIEDDDDVEEICAAPFQVHTEAVKRENEPDLRVPSVPPSKVQETQQGTRGLVDKGKAVLLEFQKLFGSEGVSMSINSEGKLVVATTLSLDQESRPRTSSARSNPASSEGAPAWTSSHTYPPSCDSRSAPLRQLLPNFSPHRPYFEVSSNRPEHHNPAFQQPIAEFSVGRDLANFGPKPIEAVPPNRHEQMQGTVSNLPFKHLSPVGLSADSGAHLPVTEGRFEGPMDLSKHVSTEEPPTQLNAGLDLVDRSVGDSSVDSDQLLRPELVKKPESSRLNILSVVVVKKDQSFESRQVSSDFELCIVEDEKTGRTSADQQCIEASDPLSVSNVDESAHELVQTDLGYAAVIVPAQTAKLSVNPILVLDEQHHMETLEPLLKSAEVLGSSDEALSQGYNAIQDPAKQEIVENPVEVLLSVATAPRSSLVTGCDETQCNPGHLAVVAPVQNTTDIVTTAAIPDIYPVELLNLAGIAAEQPYQLCGAQDAPGKCGGSDSTSSDSDKLYIDVPEHPGPARNRSPVKRHKTKAELKQKITSIGDETNVDELPLKDRSKTDSENPRNRRRSNSQKSASGKSPTKSPARISNPSAPKPRRPRKSASDGPAAEEMDVIYTSKLRSRSLRASKEEDVASKEEVVAPLLDQLPAVEKKLEEKTGGRPRGRPRKKSITNKTLVEQPKKPPLVPLEAPEEEEEKKQPRLNKVLIRLKENLKKDCVTNSGPEVLSVQSKKRRQVKRASFGHVTAETEPQPDVSLACCQTDNYSAIALDKPVVETIVTMSTLDESKPEHLEHALSEEVVDEGKQDIAAKEVTSECEVNGNSLPADFSCSEPSSNAKVGEENLVVAQEAVLNCLEDMQANDNYLADSAEDKTEVQEENMVLSTQADEQVDVTHNAHSEDSSFPTVEADKSENAALPVVASNEAAPSKLDEETALLNFASEYEIEAMGSPNEDELLDTSDEEDGSADSRLGTAELTQESVQSDCCEVTQTEPKQVEGSAAAALDTPLLQSCGDSDVATQGSSIVPENPPQIVEQQVAIGPEGLEEPTKTSLVEEAAVKPPDCSEICNRSPSEENPSLEEPKPTAVTAFEDKASNATEAFSPDNTLEASLEQQSQPKSDQMHFESEKIDNDFCAAVADNQEPVEASEELQSTSVEEGVDPVVAVSEEGQTEDPLGAPEEHQSTSGEELKQVEVDPFVTVSDKALSGVVEEIKEMDDVVSGKCQQPNRGEEVTGDLQEMQANADITQGVMLAGKEESHIEDTVSGAEELPKEELRQIKAVPAESLSVFDKAGQTEDCGQAFRADEKQEKVTEASKELKEMNLAVSEECQQEKRAEEGKEEYNIFDNVSGAEDLAQGGEVAQALREIVPEESLLVINKGAQTADTVQAFEESEQQEKVEEVTSEELKETEVDPLVAASIDVDKEVQIGGTLEAFERLGGQATEEKVAEEVNQVKVADEVQFEELLRDSEEELKGGTLVERNLSGVEEKSEEVDVLRQTACNAGVTISNVSSKECEAKREAPLRSVAVSKDILFIGNEAFDVEFIDHTEDTVVPKASSVDFSKEEGGKADDVVACLGSSEAEELKLTENTGVAVSNSLAPLFSDEGQFSNSSSLSKEVEQIGANGLVDVKKLPRDVEVSAEEFLEDRDFVNVPELVTDFDLEIGNCVSDKSFIAAECQVEVTVEDTQCLEAGDLRECVPVPVKCTEEVKVTSREQLHTKRGLETTMNGSEGRNKNFGDQKLSVLMKQPVKETRESRKVAKRKSPCGSLDGSKKAKLDDSVVSQNGKKGQEWQQVTVSKKAVAGPVAEKGAFDAWEPKHRSPSRPGKQKSKPITPECGKVTKGIMEQRKPSPAFKQQPEDLFFADDIPIDKSKVDKYFEHLGGRSASGKDAKKSEAPKERAVPEAEKRFKTKPKGARNDKILSYIDGFAAANQDPITNTNPVPSAPSNSFGDCSDASILESLEQDNKVEVLKLTVPEQEPKAQSLSSKQSDIHDLSTLLTRKPGRERIQPRGRKGTPALQATPTAVQSQPVGSISPAKPRKLFLEAISNATKPPMEDLAGRKAPKVKPERLRSSSLRSGAAKGVCVPATSLSNPEVGKESAPILEVREQPNMLDEQPKECYQFVPFPLEVSTDDSLSISGAIFSYSTPTLESFTNSDSPKLLESLPDSLIAEEPPERGSQLSCAVIEPSVIACNGASNVLPYFNIISPSDTFISGKPNKQTVDNTLEPIGNSTYSDGANISSTNYEDWTSLDFMTYFQNSSMVDVLTQGIEPVGQLLPGCEEPPSRPSSVFSSSGKTGSTEGQEEHERAPPPEPSSPVEAPPTKRKKRTPPNPDDRATKRRSAKTKDMSTEDGRRRQRVPRNGVPTKPRNSGPAEANPKVKRESSRLAAREFEEVLKRSVLETRSTDQDGLNPADATFDQVKKLKTNPYFKSHSKSLRVDVEKLLPDNEPPLQVPNGNKRHVYAPILSRRDFKVMNSSDSDLDFPYD